MALGAGSLEALLYGSKPMAFLYSTQLFSGYYPAGSSDTVYATASGYRTVIRSISITNQTGSAGSCRITDEAGTDIASVSSSPLLETVVLNLRAVLLSPDQLKVITTTDGFTVHCSGYELVI
jgi:hypothetical protein